MRFLAWKMRSSPRKCQRRSSVTALLVAVAMTLWGQGCNSSTSESSTSSSSGRKVRALAKPFDLQAKGCRLTQVRGSVTNGRGQVVHRGGVLDSVRWLSLEPGAVVTIKFQRGGREVSLMGPGRMLPCAGGEETIVVGSGEVQTHAGFGERAGAEALIGTPFGTLRYANAQLKVSVASDRLKVSVANGEAWWLEGKMPRIGAGEKLERSVDFRAKSSDALEVCGAESDRANEAAVALLTLGREGLAARARAHVGRRRAARVACAKAVAASLQQSDGPQLLADLNRASSSWGLALSVPSHRP